ncbi:MAG: ankyrin repeat domain-containing protein [Pseudomonadota bacterium]
MRIFFFLSLLALGVGYWAWSQPHTVHGKTVEEWFPNSQTSALAEAACEGRARRVAELVEQGANINELSPNNESTPLRWALVCENVKGVRALLEAGADPNLRMAEEQTAVTITAGALKSDLLKALLEYGGDPNAAPENTYRRALSSALGKAFQTNDWTNFDMLIEYGADINAANINGNTIAEQTAASRRYCKIHELIDIGYTNRLPSLYHSALIAGENYAPGVSNDCRLRLLDRLEELMEPGAYEDYIQADLRLNQRGLELARRRRENLTKTAP